MMEEDLELEDKLAEMINDTLALGYTLAAIGATGAKEVEFGYLGDDEKGAQARWWASARWWGRKVSCDNQPSSAAAVLGLYAIVAAGGTCTDCERKVGLGHPDGITVAARMHKGQFQVQLALGGEEAQLCVRRLAPEGWTGCGRTEPPKTPVADAMWSRAQRHFAETGHRAVHVTESEYEALKAEKGAIQIGRSAQTIADQISDAGQIGDYFGFDIIVGEECNCRRRRGWRE